MRPRIDLIGQNGGEGLHYTKVCNMCHKEKPLDDFHYLAKSKDKKQFHCKSCATLYKRSIGGSYPNHKKNHQKDYRKGLVRAAKHRAKIKKVPFDITWTDLVLTDICPVLGIPIFSDTLDNPNAPSIDRMVPELGYIKGNVSIISRRANVLKGDATILELEKILSYMKNGNTGEHYVELRSCPSS
jgi:hypothetical protein